MDAEQVIKPPNSVQLHPFVSVVSANFRSLPSGPERLFFVYFSRGPSHVLQLLVFIYYSYESSSFFSLSFFFCENFYTFQLRYRPLQVKIDIPSGAANAAADADARGGRRLPHFGRNRDRRRLICGQRARRRRRRQPAAGIWSLCASARRPLSSYLRCSRCVRGLVKFLFVSFFFRSFYGFRQIE